MGVCVCVCIVPADTWWKHWNGSCRQQRRQLVLLTQWQIEYSWQRLHKFHLAESKCRNAPNQQPTENPTANASQQGRRCVGVWVGVCLAMCVCVCGWVGVGVCASSHHHTLHLSLHDPLSRLSNTHRILSTSPFPFLFHFQCLRPIFCPCLLLLPAVVAIHYKGCTYWQFVCSFFSFNLYERRREMRCPLRSVCL